MKLEALELAVREAERFLCKAKPLYARNNTKAARVSGQISELWGSPSTAAVKRASMDLTRVLAELRRAR